MRDSNFWIGTGVGFLSALAGAAIVTWLQYRLRIKEHEYRRSQEYSDSEEQKRRREAAEREGLIALLSDIHGERDTRDHVQTILTGYLNRHPDSRFTRSALDWSQSLLPENDLGRMELSELRTLYMTVANAATTPFSEDPPEREGMITFLWGIHSTPESRDSLNRTLERHIELHPDSRFTDAALRWSRTEFSKYHLQEMDLSELRLLYTTVVSIISLAPASELFEKSREMMERMNQLSKSLESLRSALPQSQADKSGKEQE